jgi:phosphoribosylamine--glycine ligase
MKKILFYGLGNARDHANHYYSLNSDKIEYCSIIQNNNSLMEEYDNVYVIQSLNEAIKFAKIYSPDLVVISNRNDLKNGVYDSFKDEGFNVFGIDSIAAKLENNKSFAKKLMKKHKIPSPRYFCTRKLEEARSFLNKNWNKTKHGYVLKVSENAKKSFDRTSVPINLDEALKECERLFASTNNVELIIEERIIGYEISLHIIIKDGEYVLLPIVQDYKKKNENDVGAMTAGMGCVASTDSEYTQLLKMLEKETVIPTINMIKKEKILYNYILYIGVIISEDGKPFVLEYNTRSGNPEWLAILGLMKCPLTCMFDLYYTDFKRINHIWKENNNSVVIYGINSGYPEEEKTVYSNCIDGLDKINKNVKIFGEHIVNRSKKLYPSGGRVFALSYTNSSFDKAKQEIIKNFKLINMENLYFRKDIMSIKDRITKSCCD